MKGIVWQKEDVNQNAFSCRTTRDRRHSYLKTDPGLAKPRRKFVAALIATMLALRGRVNYRNLARYGEYGERSYARQFAPPFPWLTFPYRSSGTGLS